MHFHIFLNNLGTWPKVSKLFLVGDWGSVWYVCLKIENYCLKIFMEIRVGEKVCENAWNVV